MQLTTNAQEVLTDPDIDVVVELIGGYKPAKEFILEAIRNKKHVVTANKALLAVHGEEIYAAAEKAGVTLGFEASVAGGIPILAAIRSGLAANNIKSIYGIVNGTCNYILTLMTNAGRKFDEVLKEAQAMGYAEADPTFDIEGIDSAHKLAVLTMLAYGTPVKFDDIYTEGISKITPLDIDFAKDLGYKIKLLAITKMANGEIEARVHPTMLPENYPIATVDGVFNALSVVGDAVGSTMFYGRGAGDMPTGSAVVSDIIDIGRDILAGCVGPVAGNGIPGAEIAQDPEDGRHHVLLLSPVLGAGQAGRAVPNHGRARQEQYQHLSMIQKGRKIDEAVPIVMMTHEAVERDVRKALDEINKMDCVCRCHRGDQGGRGKAMIARSGWAITGLTHTATEHRYFVEVIMADDIKIDKTLDIKGQVCPYTFVRSKLAIEKMNLGEVLEIVTDHKPASENVPRAWRTKARRS